MCSSITEKGLLAVQKNPDWAILVLHVGNSAYKNFFGVSYIYQMLSFPLTFQNSR